MDIVLVEWIDASHNSENILVFEQAINRAVAPAKTIGVLLKKDKDKVILAMTVFEAFKTSEGDVPEAYKVFWTIPTGCIKKIKKLGKV